MNRLQSELQRRATGSIEQFAAVGIPGLQPLFYFGGGFRTWADVKTRAGLNKAIAARIPSYRLTGAA